MASHSSLAKLRLMPGAMLRPIIAASIGMVPEPQQGSTRMRSFFQNESNTIAAASVSLIGASTLDCR